MSRALAAVAVVGLLALAGCGGKSDNPMASGSSGGHSHDDHGDDVDDAGPYHARLTAHLSEKAGENEIDLVFETQDKKNPKPVPLPITKIVAKAKREGDPKEYELTFEPDDPKERKDDPPGKCSRFSAKVPWMKPDDKLTVTTTVEIETKPRDLAWKNFVPKKYSHKHDD
jgi:hypothetical protein